MLLSFQDVPCFLSLQSSCGGDAAPHHPPPLRRGGETGEPGQVLLRGRRQPGGDHRVAAEWPPSQLVSGGRKDAAQRAAGRESPLPERRRQEGRSVTRRALRLRSPEQCRQGHQPQCVAVYCR